MKAVLRVVLTLIGIALLLPGACSLLFSPMMLMSISQNAVESPPLIVVWLAGFAAAAVGVGLLRLSWKR